MCAISFTDLFMLVHVGVNVAIKISTPTEITVEVIDVFVKEGLLSTNLQHKNIVKFFGVCVRPPQIAMVMELCDGGDLKSNIRKNPQFWTPLERLGACLSAARGVSYLHSAGYIHRDIKTENFFVNKPNEVKLGDFGESCRERPSPQDGEDDSQTRRMTILGTIAYMAPELIAAAKFYTSAVDIFALAITFWEIWTGQTAYETNTQFEVYKLVEDGNRPDIVNIDAPIDFIQLIKMCWHQDPDARPTAEEVCSRYVLSSFLCIAVLVISKCPMLCKFVQTRINYCRSWRRG
jgi:serine/threonine protein kinase